MEPGAGEHVLRFVGDRLRIRLRASESLLPAGSRAFLRTTLGRAGLVRLEVLGGQGRDQPVDGTAWRNVPMRPADDGWELDLTLTEPGYFRAKAFALDERGFQVWPHGPDLGVTVHPDAVRTANTIYCAFTRLFGPTKTATRAQDPRREARFQSLEALGCTVIPRSGTLRSLIAVLPHIIETLGCRILHLLPVNPTPTTYARFGRFGSPYAGLDLTAIDPALVEFDKRTTAVDQFRELAYATHARGARLFLDLVINHTGWGSWLLDNHPEWFRRNPDGTFVSPGAWGVTWEDLVELDGSHRGLWEHIADAFLTWCRRGVDGFRCDAGYKVPMHVWRYIIARVRAAFPETIFLLEGLGGGWQETELLLTEGGMQWAYSELFQEYQSFQVAGYLDHAHKQTRRVGALVHYSETHDNDRLAARGRAWSLLRNRLCALTSVNGGFGFACGVEWLATENIRVHGSAGLAWDSPDNIVPELARLNRLLANHPCFFDHAALTRLSPSDSPILALRRDSAEGLDHLLVLVNLELDRAHEIALPADALELGGPAGAAPVDLLGQTVPAFAPATDRRVRLRLPAGGALCLAASPEPKGLAGPEYRRARAQADFLLKALRQRFDPEAIGPFQFAALAGLVDTNPVACLSALASVNPAELAADPVAALRTATAMQPYPAVVRWTRLDRRRITPVPPAHWLLIEDASPFRATLQLDGYEPDLQAQSIPVRTGHVACFPPVVPAGDATLHLERYGDDEPSATAAVRFLAAEPRGLDAAPGTAAPTAPSPARTKCVLLTNGRGGMARLGVDFGRVTSKYDCLLGANLHAALPVDRHIFAKRARLWANAFGFISPLDGENLVDFQPGPPARWLFRANAGDGRLVDLEVLAWMPAGRNTTVLRLRHLATGRLSAADARAETSAALDVVRLTVRVDLEDRNFHTETKHSGSAEYHFHTRTHTLADRPGFRFTPAPDRQLRVYADAGTFHAAPEWCDNIPHPIEATRGQEAHGDAFSPGWFDLPLELDRTVTLVVCADPTDPSEQELTRGSESGSTAALPVPGSEPRALSSFPARLAQASRAFIVRRDDVKTVIAGYPWFLDWGRDTLICARGLLAGGWVDDVRQLIIAFGRFEERGTLPNTIHGTNATNRDTVDAPLWYGVVCEELAAREGAAHASQGIYATRVDAQGRTVAEVLGSIAHYYLHGTPNGIRVDRASGLVWSPAHFTWMDTNYPAGTPREGYPIEIQILWVRLLRQLDRIGAWADAEPWARLAARADESWRRLFWLEELGYLSDVLLAPPRTAAAQATPDKALRSNMLFATSLGLLQGRPAQRSVEAARHHLLVPGAMRSLAPLPVSPPLSIRAPDGRLLNHPDEPYWGRYEGDEDTARKVAYHNGTAWVWTLPTFCEALALAWNRQPAAVAAARAYLASTDCLLAEGCLGHLPEIVDGDAPHAQRGCDAQAWSVTETLRVWRLLEGPTAH